MTRSRDGLVDQPVSVGDPLARRSRPVLDRVSPRTLLSGGSQWVLISQILAFAGAFLLIKLAATLGSVAQFGRFVVVFAMAGAVNSLIFGPIGQWASRHYQEAHATGELRAYYRTAAVSVVAGVGVCGVLTVAFMRTALLERLGLTDILFVLGVLFGVASGINEVSIAITNAARRRRLSSVAILASSWLRIAGLLLVYGLGGRSLLGWVAGIVVAIGALATAQIFLLIREYASCKGELPGNSYLGSVRTYMLPFIVWGLPAYALTLGDRVLVAYFSDPVTVGIYAAMVSATMSVANVVTGSVSRAVEPTIYAVSGEVHDDARMRQAHMLVRYTVIATVALAGPYVFVCWLWPNRIIALFASAEYGSHGGRLWLLAAAAMVFLLSQQIIMHGLVEKRPWLYIGPRYVHAVLLVTGLFVLVPKSGLNGAIWSVLAAQIVQLALVVLVNRVGLRVR